MIQRGDFVSFYCKTDIPFVGPTADGKCLRATIVPDNFFQAKRSQGRNFYPIASSQKYWSIAAVYGKGVPGFLAFEIRKATDSVKKSF
jgi:hypothetical protein